MQWLCSHVGLPSDLKNTCLHYDCPNIVLHASRSIQDRLSPWLAATPAQRPTKTQEVSPSNLGREVLQEVVGGEGPSLFPSLLNLSLPNSTLNPPPRIPNQAALEMSTGTTIQPSRLVLSSGSSLILLIDTSSSMIALPPTPQYLVIGLPGKTKKKSKLSSQDTCSRRIPIMDQHIPRTQGDLVLR